MSGPVASASVSREDCPHRRTLGTRWRDNDQYGHVNNVVYYEWFDTVVNDWMIARGLDVAGDVVAFVVASSCDYHAPVSFPDPVEVGLRIGHLGRSSVRWELAVFVDGRDEPVASGQFVHVFVTRAAGTTVPVPDRLRAAMDGLVVA